MLSPKKSSFVLLIAVLLVSPTIASGQDLSPQPLQRDAQALQILEQVLNAAGGVGTIAAVRDFSGTGTVTFNWAGEEVKGNASVKGRGVRQFRLDASFQDGVRTWTLSNGQASKKEADGTVKSVPYQSAMSFESLTFPYTHLMIAFRDPSVSVSFLGLDTIDGIQAYHIRVQKLVAPSDDPGGIRSKLSRKDFIIDSGTFSILAIRETIRLESRVTVDLPHELRFSNYQKVDGLLVPFSIAEFTGGISIFTIQLDLITFNAGLTDGDFDH